jgi:hypothetical protein
MFRGDAQISAAKTRFVVAAHGDGAADTTIRERRYGVPRHRGGNGWFRTMGRERCDRVQDCGTRMVDGKNEMW